MNTTSALRDEFTRRIDVRDSCWARNVALLIGLCGLAVSFQAEAGKPGSGGATASNPDIVYMSASSKSVNSAELRGVTLSLGSGAITSADSSLISNAIGRSYASVTWSPDGKRFAWIQNGAIMTAAPGAKPVKLYPTNANDPQPLGNTDTLTWGPDCCNGGDSVLVFLSGQPFGVRALTIKAGVVDSSELLLALTTHCDQLDPPKCTTSTASAFAFSPQGQLLAFFGYSDDLSPGVWVIPMGAASHAPSLIVTYGAIGATAPPVISMDWSSNGKRLALSVITGPDPANYDWRDLKIVDVVYGLNGGVETASFGAVRGTNPGSSFGGNSSEHSPQWDPSASGDTCERLAFSQSSDAGRKMYLIDLAAASGCDSTLRSVSAKNPRALDWRLKQ